ncbi:RNA polymerase subunit AC19 [Batrachochytrium dendrobatidis]|uniref:DNA-directed RNA polymerases I and III subunit RPAC2 n=2 Tax=Batrachochytrium dendrobatidis TaxID=109871 RepID=A0A177WSA8_BATDL|nr:RNA polymerase subunit AC19 [Batrachochytrium dendrobatidis]KAK5667444.1 RNA polymerase subunit AC19 [Batrachochytrium dendrobatidis]OAJ42299.1 RNA polymerase Rpb3/Rpb11 dimerization domain-containing protein [Batrachochytrium dendrobatidis JEL423]OAJ42300.1 RNA polymerase Rpb3/Rpb11 dimerization domain-containing protein, variant [Batrachochytrium dendrobatidis JEL423]
MAMVEPSVEGGTRGVPYIPGPKITVLATDSQDLGSATFCISNEDHTLGNALRYIIMKNPAVSFCGYSVPHPSEYQINLRIQTDGSITAVDALHKGLDDLVDMTTHVKESFKDKVKQGEFEIHDGADIHAK